MNTKQQNTTLVTPEQNPGVVTIYSLEVCPKCMMTKKRFDALGIPYVSIIIDEGVQQGEEGAEERRDAYINMLKADPDSRMTMPVVYPPEASGLGAWQDFQVGLINKLGDYYKENPHTPEETAAE